MRPLHLPAGIVLVATLLEACATSAPTLSATLGPAAPSAMTASADATPGSDVGAALPACRDDASWKCGTVSVPIDRRDPAGGSIDIHVYVLPRTDLSRPALEPVVVTPGGPGASIWRDHGFVPIASWQDRHDTVLVEPRGVGASGAIVCPALDAGVGSAAALRAAVVACAAGLGGAADRYGSGDVALDIEDVRTAMGIDTFDYYAASYATAALQAYAVRFPQHLHALVIDSGFPMSETLRSYWWGVDYPAAWIRVNRLLCERDPTCSASYKDPAGLLTRLVERLAAEPAQAPSSPSPPDTVTADEAAMEAILASTGARPDQEKPTAILHAASELLDRGDAEPLLRLVRQHPLWPTAGSEPTDFSNGDNAAVTCSDIDTAWAKTDPPSAREARLAAAVAALPPDTFTPFTPAGWAAGAAPFLDLCLDWPVPDRIEPVIPPGATFPDVPALVLTGDEDTQAPSELSRRIAADFPRSTVAVVAEAGHDAAAPFYGDCAGNLVASFLDTLAANAGACAPR